MLEFNARMLIEAPKLFVRLFDQLMLGCFITQGELSRRATILRDRLVEAGAIERCDVLFGSMTQPVINNILKGTQRPNRGQLMLFLAAIEDWCNDDIKMPKRIKKLGVSRPYYPYELEKDFYHLALFGSNDEICEACAKWRDSNLLEHLELQRRKQEEKNTDELSIPQTEKSPC